MLQPQRDQHVPQRDQHVPQRDQHVPRLVAGPQAGVAWLAPWEAAEEEVGVHCGHQRSPVLLMLVAKHVWYLHHHDAALASRSEAH